MNENSPDFQLYRWLKSDNGEIGLYENLGTIVWKEHFEMWNDEVRDKVKILTWIYFSESKRLFAIYVRNLRMNFQR